MRSKRRNPLKNSVYIRKDSGLAKGDEKESRIIRWRSILPYKHGTNFAIYCPFQLPNDLEKEMFMLALEKSALKVISGVNRKHDEDTCAKL